MSSKLLIEVNQAPQQVAMHLQMQEARYIELIDHLKQKKIRQLITVARGSSDHAAAYLAYLCMIKLGIVATSLPMSLATLHKVQFDATSALAVAFSQSGQSPDLSMTMNHLSQCGAETLALVNASTSPLAASAARTIALLAGPENSVAATKSFIAQLVASLCLVSHWSADQRLLKAKTVLVEALQSALKLDWTTLAGRFESAEKMFIVSRGLGMPAALEAALKLKEICGIQAEAISNAEIKHGPMALIDRDFPVLVFATSGPELQGLLDFAQQMRQRGANLVMAGPAGAHGVDLPIVQTGFSELDTITAIQSFYPLIEALSRLRGLDPDKPPHLTKITQTQ